MVAGNDQAIRELRATQQSAKYLHMTGEDASLLVGSVAGADSTDAVHTRVHMSAACTRQRPQLPSGTLSCDGRYGWSSCGIMTNQPRPRAAAQPKRASLIDSLVSIVDPWLGPPLSTKRFRASNGWPTGFSKRCLSNSLMVSASPTASRVAKTATLETS
ncbi:hypothetical protein LIA77_02697 [Sarocladium implicatum]|nr:hypothetical protein LIA77_02697 [Sarocladium implicatum]